MKDEDYHELRALCGVAGKEAQDLQPAASIAREAAARSRRKLFWKVLAGTSSAAITIAVLAVNHREPAPSVAQTSGASVAPPQAAAYPVCERLDCTPTVSDQSASSLAEPVVQHLVPSVASIPPALAEAAQPESRAASQPTTQAEKELADSQPDGSC